MKNDNAVSPVIGVILMVAITVILSAVIAAFVFGMVGNVPSGKSVAAIAQQPTQDQIIVTYQGGVDSPEFKYGVVSVFGDDNKTVTKYTNKTITDGATGNILGSEVGSYVIAKGTFTARNHVTVVGYFMDDSAQVLLDTYL